MQSREALIYALLNTFNKVGVEIVKTDVFEQKNFLIVPKGIEVERVKNLVQFTFGKQMRVFVKERGGSLNVLQSLFSKEVRQQKSRS